jgi:hypothetical protein
VLASPADARDRKPPRPVKPEPAVGDFTSVNYPMTFKAPPNAFYCPLSDDWVGSDHGTTVFLALPKACYGAGYPSSSRGFEPGDVPRIDVYYGWDQREDDWKPPPCHAAGTATLFEKPVKLCRDLREGMTTVTANGYYTVDKSGVELSVTLVTKPIDANRYMPVLKALLATMHSCTATWRAADEKGKIVRSGQSGHGPRCPPGQWY